MIECVEKLGFRCEYIPSKKDKIGRVELEIEGLRDYNKMRF